jgi:hypothetical protein
MFPLQDLEVVLSAHYAEGYQNQGLETVLA